RTVDHHAGRDQRSREPRDAPVGQWRAAPVGAHRRHGQRRRRARELSLAGIDAASRRPDRHRQPRLAGIPAAAQARRHEEGRDRRDRRDEPEGGVNIRPTSESRSFLRNLLARNAEAVVYSLTMTRTIALSWVLLLLCLSACIPTSVPPSGAQQVPAPSYSE